MRTRTNAERMREMTNLVQSRGIDVGRLGMWWLRRELEARGCP